MIRAKLLVFSVFTTLLFLPAAKLAAGNIAYVHCRAGEEYVYLYQSTETFQVVTNLKCNQQVEIMDSGNTAWVRVRTADAKEGYLPQTSLAAALPGSPRQTSPQPAAPRATEPPAPVPQATAPVAPAPNPAPAAVAPAAMAPAPVPAAVIPPPAPVAPAPAAVAPAPLASVGASLSRLSRLDESDTPRLEISGGYSFLNADTNGLSQSRQNVNGFESSFTFDGTERLGAEMNFSGYFLSPSENTINLGAGRVNLDQSEYDILGGARYNFRKFFVHGLIGMDRMSLVPLGTRVSQDSLAIAVGLGKEWKVSRHFAVKTSGDWLYTTHNLYNLVTPGFPNYMQNSIRISVGIAYRAGSVPEPE